MIIGQIIHIVFFKAYMYTAYCTFAAVLVKNNNESGSLVLKDNSYSNKDSKPHSF